MSTLESARPVRVTIDATAQRVTRRRHRVTFSGGSFLVSDGAEDVVLEDLAPARTWTDGDVVQGSRVWERRDGQWWAAMSPGMTVDASDADVDADVDAGAMRVLRYQAGA